MAKKYRACLFFLITGMGVMISAGVAANPVPEPDITIEKGPGPSDVSIIIGCWSSALEPCMDMKYYRDGKEFPCKMEDYNPTKASSYSYDQIIMRMYRMRGQAYLTYRRIQAGKMMGMQATLVTRDPGRTRTMKKSLIYNKGVLTGAYHWVYTAMR